jgi:ABC-type multidrug transport system ATPase subunit
LDVFYGSSQILFALGLSVLEGQTTALLGRNGAGKSTTMKALAGLAPPRRGRVRIMGVEFEGKKPHAIARAGIGFVPEELRPWSWRASASCCGACATWALRCCWPSRTCTFASASPAMPW